VELSRNQPCPCRSGQKYKRCCLPLHERARAANTPLPYEQLGAHFQALDALSNRVIDLLEAGKHDAALDVCRQLLDEHADQPDGLERLAEVYAAMGDRSQAALAFRKAALFHQVLTPMNVETAGWHYEQADRMDAGLDIGPLPGDDEEG
jgi:tetratricopeptide (TPR) repeat protein